MAVTLTFVKAESGEYHRVWLKRRDSDAVGVTLHVRHDLPHLVIESILGIEWGLWAELERTGRYPGLTECHMAAKALTNAIVAAGRYGTATVADVRAGLKAAAQPARAARASYDHEFALRVNQLVADRLDALREDTIGEAVAQLERVFDAWATTPPGGQMHLSWPLEDREGVA